MISHCLDLRHGSELGKEYARIYTVANRCMGFAIALFGFGLGFIPGYEFAERFYK